MAIFHVRLAHCKREPFPCIMNLALGILAHMLVQRWDLLLQMFSALQSKGRIHSPPSSSTRISPSSQSIWFLVPSTMCKTGAATEVRACFQERTSAPGVREPRVASSSYLSLIGNAPAQVAIQKAAQQPRSLLRATLKCVTTSRESSFHPRETYRSTASTGGPGVAVYFSRR
eukprot:scaffold748_cov251-Pinguiococcus_pyrenoidosus.AAC.4